MLLRLFALTIFLAVGGALPLAAQNLDPLTADELLQKANLDYSAARWELAAAGYAKFIADFAQRPEAQAAAARVRYPLARCYLQLRKFPEALAAIDEALRAQPPLAQADVQELSFWRGVCEVQEEKYGEARASLARFIALFPADAWRQPAYVKQFPASRNVSEAQLLIATCFLLESKLAEAAEYCAQIRPGLAVLNRGRATVLELYARVESGDHAAALALVKAEYPRARRADPDRHIPDAHPPARGDLIGARGISRGHRLPRTDLAGRAADCTSGKTPRGT